MTVRLVPPGARGGNTAGLLQCAPVSVNVRYGLTTSKIRQSRLCTTSNRIRLLTGRKTEFPMVGVIRFETGKMAGEHLYWDQATVLSQLGILNSPVVTAGAGAAVKLLKRSTQRG